MTDVTVQFSDETLAALDAVAAAEHDGDREQAARALLEEWLSSP